MLQADCARESRQFFVTPQYQSTITLEVVCGLDEVLPKVDYDCQLHHQALLAFVVVEDDQQAVA